MSNNLVRQIVKAGGSFFVGASIVVGILGHTVLTSSRVLASSISSPDIPTKATDELKTLYSQGITPKTIAFAPNGEWVILYGDNGYYGIVPQDVKDALATLYNQGSTINTIAFTPNGEWVIIYDGYGYYPSANFPQDTLNKLLTLNQQKSTINTIAFTPNGEWIIISNNGNNANWSTNFPPDAANEIRTLYNQNSTINSVAFAPTGGFVILYGSNGYYISSNVPQGAANAIVKEGNLGYLDLINIAFTPSNGWALLYKDDLALEINAINEVNAEGSLLLSVPEEIK